MNTILSQTENKSSSISKRVLPQEIGQKYGMTLIESFKMVPVGSLRFNKEYQRAIDKNRVKKISNNITKWGGFLPGESLYVNQDDEVVDGQQRLTAAIQCGVKLVPISKYRFLSKEKEAEFFVDINNFNTTLSPVDYWYGRYLMKDILGLSIYMFNDAKGSMLYQKIAVKGSKTNSKWSITSVLEIIALASGIGQNFWSQKSDNLFVRNVKKTDPDKLLRAANSFVGWFENIFGVKHRNAVVYRQDSFRAIMFFYRKLLEMGLAHNTATINKMKTFAVDSNYITAPLVGKKMSLINHYNNKRKTGRISYEI